jgi:hypothetical protein
VSTEAGAIQTFAQQIIQAEPASQLQAFVLLRERVGLIQVLDLPQAQSNPWLSERNMASAN